MITWVYMYKHMDEMEWIVSQLKSKKRRKIMETRKLKKKKKGKNDKETKL